MYNLLVTTQAQDRNHGSFEMPRGRFLEWTQESISVQIRPLSVEAIDCIRSWPLVLMQEGRGDEPAHIVQVEDIGSSGSEITASVISLPQSPKLLNDTLWKLRGELDIDEFEFNRNHWAIKDRDLFGVLVNNGVEIDGTTLTRFQNKPLPWPSRSLMIGSRDALASLSHSDLDDLLLEAGIPSLSAARDVGSRRDRAHAIVKFAIDNPSTTTAENSLFSAFLIRRVNGLTSNPISATATTNGAEYKDDPTLAPSSDSKAPPQSSNRVFVVHGRNEAARHSVVAFLSTLGLRGIVLHEQPNMGRHLLTKFIDEAELTTFAVVLMTDDDIGGLKDAPLAPRARQNVILELGYFLAHFGQQRVCALITPGLETPSDFDGIVYIQMDASERWKIELSRELKAVGMPITQ